MNMKKYRNRMVEEIDGWWYDVDEVDQVMRLKDVKIEARGQQIEGLKTAVEQLKKVLERVKGAIVAGMVKEEIPIFSCASDTLTEISIMVDKALKGE